MPREMHPDLRDCLERANPYTEYRIELSQPDTSQILRRQDQFTQPPYLVSMTPPNSLRFSPTGCLELVPIDVPLVSFTGTQASDRHDLNAADANGTTRYKGLSWQLDDAFSQCTLASVRVKVQRDIIGLTYPNTDLELQIFQVTRVPGERQLNVGSPNYQSQSVLRTYFGQLLNPAPVLKSGDQKWDANNRADFVYSLVNYRPVLGRQARSAALPNQPTEYLFTIRLVGKPPTGTGHFKWLTDTASVRDIAGVGKFERVFWSKDGPTDEWLRTAFLDVPNLTF